MFLIFVKVAYTQKTDILGRGPKWQEGLFFSWHFCYLFRDLLTFYSLIVRFCYTFWWTFYCCGSVYSSVSSSGVVVVVVVGGGGGGGYASLLWGKGVWLLLLECRLLLTKTDWTCPTNQMTWFLTHEITVSSLHQPIGSQEKEPIRK